jgi:hypothetical protein
MSVQCEFRERQGIMDQFLAAWPHTDLKVVNAKTLYILLHIYRVNTYEVTADSCKDFYWRLPEYTLHTLLLCQFIKFG